MDTTLLEFHARLSRQSGPYKTRKLIEDYIPGVAPNGTTCALLGEKLGLFSDDRKMLLRIAAILFEADDWVRGARFYRQVLQLDPSHLKSMRRAFYCYRKLGRWHATLEMAELTTEQPRAVWRDFFELAKVQDRLGSNEGSLVSLRAAYAMNPCIPELAERLAVALDHAGDVAEADDVRQRSDRRVPKLTAADVVARIQRSMPEGMSGFIVNIGCRDGKSWSDPCYELFRSGYAGLAVDAGYFPEIFQNLPQPEIAKLLRTTITPMNVVDVLEKVDTPTELDLLSIDIDSFDGMLLAPILQAYRPKVIHMEVNRAIPPR